MERGVLMSYQEDRLTEIADAIRSVKGTTGTIKASNFAGEIEGIPIFFTFVGCKDGDHSFRIKIERGNSILFERTTPLTKFPYFQKEVKPNDKITFTWANYNGSASWFVMNDGIQEIWNIRNDFVGSKSVIVGHKGLTIIYMKRDPYNEYPWWELSV